MKVLQCVLALALCTFAKGAKALGIEYTHMNNFDSKDQDLQKSLEKTADYAKSMIQSMETKLSETQKYVSILEEKLNMCGQNNLLIKQLEKKLKASEEASKEYLIRMKSLEERLVKSEHIQNVHAESVIRRLVNLENKLFNIDELEEKTEYATSTISKVEQWGRKLEGGSNLSFQIDQKPDVDDIVLNTSSSDVKKTAYINTNSDKDVALDQWNVGKINKTKQVFSPQERDVGADIYRDSRVAREDRVAFRVSGISRGDGHYTGERITFSSLDYSEGGGYDMTSGTFTCPTTGTYFFTATIGSVNKIYIDAVLKIDGVVKMSLYAGFHLQGDNMSTAVTIAHCMVGQSVWMEVTNGDHLGGWEAMSGFLLWSDIASK